MNPAPPLLHVEALEVGLEHGGTAVPLVDRVSFSVAAGEAFGIVGESGCGKSTTVRAIIRLLSDRLHITGGSISFAGEDITRAGEEDLRRLRGAGIGMVFQDPLTALNPVLTAGTQVTETLAYHREMGGAARRNRMIEVLRLVGLPDPARIATSYPHELSGGQRQRVAIAIALACSPRLLLADEPTTALDVTIQAQILHLLSDLRASLGMALVLVTHDLGVIAQTCGRVAVMYAGRIVEEAPVIRLFANPAHPYTVALLNSIPQGARAAHPLAPIPGMPPDRTRRPAGCGFAPRCPRRQADCDTTPPPWTPVNDGGFACHHPVSVREDPADG